MNILILTNYANGLYLFRKELIEAFRKDGHKVYVSVPKDENCHKLSKIGARLIYAPLDRHGLNPAKDFSLFLNYIGTIRKVKPKVVLTYTIKPNIYGASAAKLLRVPYICNVTGLGMAIEHGGLFSKVLMKLYAFSMNRAQRVFFQNEKNRAFMQKNGIAVKNSGMLPGSGVNTTEHPYREYPSEENGIRILAVLRVMKDKGIEEYFEAARAVSEAHPEVKFHLVGEYEEDERSKYEPMIRKLEDKGIMKYHGHLDTVEPVYADMHIVVHPSYHEGLTNVLLEAGACGRPVLGSDIPGCRETFIDGRTGFSFKPMDSGALIAAIERMLLLSADERRGMGLEGRNYIVENFDRNLVIEAYRKELSALKN
ncbi:MAG: glycosyltransferase family 4 protein [Butyrivibrio sp.]|nr:glycosyltransferase family 4 protein [Butyrivibrio sp.]